MPYTPFSNAIATYARTKLTDPKFSRLHDALLEVAGKAQEYFYAFMEGQQTANEFFELHFDLSALKAAKKALLPIESEIQAERDKFEAQRDALRQAKAKAEVAAEEGREFDEALEEKLEEEAAVVEGIRDEHAETFALYDGERFKIASCVEVFTVLYFLNDALAHWSVLQRSKAPLQLQLDKPVLHMGEALFLLGKNLRGAVEAPAGFINPKGVGYARLVMDLLYVMSKESGAELEHWFLSGADGSDEAGKMANAQRLKKAFGHCSKFQVTGITVVDQFKDDFKDFTYVADEVAGVAQASEPLAEAAAKESVGGAGVPTAGDAPAKNQSVWRKREGKGDAGKKDKSPAGRRSKLAKGKSKTRPGVGSVAGTSASALLAAAVARKASRQERFSSVASDIDGVGDAGVNVAVTNELAEIEEGSSALAAAAAATRAGFSTALEDAAARSADVSPGVEALAGGHNSDSSELTPTGVASSRLGMTPTPSPPPSVGGGGRPAFFEPKPRMIRVSKAKKPGERVDIGKTKGSKVAGDASPATAPPTWHF